MACNPMFFMKEKIIKDPHQKIHYLWLEPILKAKMDKNKG
jgi:hypothetical protein